MTRRQVWRPWRQARPAGTARAAMRAGPAPLTPLALWHRRPMRAASGAGFLSSSLGSTLAFGVVRRTRRLLASASATLLLVCSPSGGDGGGARVGSAPGCTVGGMTGLRRIERQFLELGRRFGALRQGAFALHTTTDQHAAQEQDDRHHGEGHEHEHQLLAVQLDLVKAVVFSVMGQVERILARPNRQRPACATRSSTRLASSDAGSSASARVASAFAAVASLASR